MTKAVTSTAAMQLVERGIISLDTPVADLVPDWAEMKVLEGWDGDVPRLREPRTTATVRHLASHTSGATYEFLDEGHLRWVGNGHPPLLSGLRKVLHAPLAFDPGTNWLYGQGIDWLGLCVESASGLPLDQYFAQHIFEPAGMDETGFRPTAEQKTRLVKVHMRDGNGTLSATDMDWPESPEFWPGGHPVTELISLSPVLSNDAEFFPGSAKVHSTAFMINLEDQPGMRPGGSAAWAGIFNSFYWWDPSNDITAVLMMQLLPFADADALAILEGFERAVYASL